MRTMLDVRGDICGAICAAGKPPNGRDFEALEAILAACPADAVARIARLEAENVLLREYKQPPEPTVIGSNKVKFYED